MIPGEETVTPSGEIVYLFGCKILHGLQMSMHPTAVPPGIARGRQAKTVARVLGAVLKGASTLEDISASLDIDDGSARGHVRTAQRAGLLDGPYSNLRATSKARRQFIVRDEVYCTGTEFCRDCNSVVAWSVGKPVEAECRGPCVGDNIYKTPPLAAKLSTPPINEREQQIRERYYRFQKYLLDKSDRHKRARLRTEASNGEFEIQEFLSQVSGRVGKTRFA